MEIVLLQNSCVDPVEQVCYLYAHDMYEMFWKETLSFSKTFCQEVFLFQSTPNK